MKAWRVGRLGGGARWESEQVPYLVRWLVVGGASLVSSAGLGRIQTLLAFLGGPPPTPAQRRIN